MTSTGPTDYLSAEFTRRGLHGIRPGLERIATVLDELGRPQDHLGRIIHLAGTNGKGSTAAFLESILRAAGCTTAMMTSPHLMCITERIRVSGTPVSQSTFEAAARQVATAETIRKTVLTGFEFLTAAGFLVMAQSHPAYSIVETGLGGRLDATNVMDSALSILTPIALDHTVYLGPTPEAIAAEKVGITRPNRPCITARQSDGVTSVIESHAHCHGITLLSEGADFAATGSDLNWNFVDRDRCVKSLRLGLPGLFQVQNAALATAAAAQFLTPETWRTAVLSGVPAACWPGRFDLRQIDGQSILFDGAHNPAGLKAFISAFRQRYSDSPHVLCALKKDKDADGMLNQLEEFAAGLIVTSPGTVEGLAPGSVAARISGIPVTCEPDPVTALNLLLHRDNSGIKVVCGSLYLVGYLLAALPPRE